MARNLALGCFPLFLFHLPAAGPPSEPQQLTLFAPSAFSAGLSWDPPSDNGGSTEPLTYTVILTNITDGTVLPYNFTTTQTTLTNLQPGVQYNVSVYAQHSLASEPPVAEVFRTNYSVPIIEQVSIEYNNELNFRVSVTLGTNGGKSTTNYYTCPGMHVRDILANAEARTTQWLLDEKERYKKEAEAALMKKELQRKEKLLESQKNEISKTTKYLDALTEVRQLREKANWKAGIGLPGAGEEEFLSDIEELKQCLAARTSLDEVNMS